MNTAIHETNATLDLTKTLFEHCSTLTPLVLVLTPLISVQNWTILGKRKTWKYSTT